jgi:hypothetical protein
MYQNSVVHVDAFDSKMQKTAYYGQIEEIWELLYLGFKVPVSMGSGKSRCHERQLWLHYD